MSNNVAGKLKPENGLPQGLSQPALRALAGAGCFSLEQVARFSEAEVSRWHGIGPKGIRLLQEALAENGLSFAQSEISIRNIL